MYDLCKAHPVLYFRCNEPHPSVETRACAFQPDNEIIPQSRKELMDSEDGKNSQRQWWSRRQGQVRKALTSQSHDRVCHILKPLERFQRLFIKKDAADRGFRKVTLCARDSKSQCSRQRTHSWIAAIQANDDCGQGEGQKGKIYVNKLKKHLV